MSNLQKLAVWEFFVKNLNIKKKSSNTSFLVFAKKTFALFVIKHSQVNIMNVENRENRNCYVKFTKTCCLGTFRKK